MEAKTEVDNETYLEAQEKIWGLMFGFADSMALKCAIRLRIADIIQSHSSPVTLTQIASSISNSPSIPYLSRIMRSLVHKKIFTAYQPLEGGEIQYGLNTKSKFLLWDTKESLVPMILMETHPIQMAPWHYLSDCVKDGGIAFEKAHGCEMWDFASQNPDFNKLFNDGMACAVKMVMGAVLSEYKDGFDSIGSLVDVGGGTGGVIEEIVKAHPHIKGVNFDLPHVISTAPVRNGVTHVGGDMFQAIPTADAVFIKWVLHDWSDEHCVKILRNCRKAILGDQKSGGSTGKVIIVDIVLDEEADKSQDYLFKNTRMMFDILMMAHTTGGKERTETEWKKLLEEAGFPRYQIIRIPTIPSIIEAYPF